MPQTTKAGAFTVGSAACRPRHARSGCRRGRGRCAAFSGKPVARRASRQGRPWGRETPLSRMKGPREASCQKARIPARLGRMSISPTQGMLARRKWISTPRRSIPDVRKQQRGDTIRRHDRASSAIRPPSEKPATCARGIACALRKSSANCTGWNGVGFPRSGLSVRPKPSMSMAKTRCRSARTRVHVRLPIQHRTADAVQQDDGRTPRPGLPVSRPNLADADITIFEAAHGAVLSHRYALSVALRQGTESTSPPLLLKQADRWNEGIDMRGLRARLAPDFAVIQSGLRWPTAVHENSGRTAMSSSALRLAAIAVASACAHRVGPCPRRSATAHPQGPDRTRWP